MALHPAQSLQPTDSVHKRNGCSRYVAMDDQTVTGTCTTSQYTAALEWSAVVADVSCEEPTHTLQQCHHSPHCPQFSAPGCIQLLQVSLKYWNGTCSKTSTTYSSLTAASRRMHNDMCSAIHACMYHTGDGTPPVLQLVYQYVVRTLRGRALHKCAVMATPKPSLMPGRLKTSEVICCTH
jgi:hypothetical protein